MNQSSPIFPGGWSQDNACGAKKAPPTRGDEPAGAGRLLGAQPVNLLPNID